MTLIFIRKKCYSSEGTGRDARWLTAVSVLARNEYITVSYLTYLRPLIRDVHFIKKWPA